MAKLSGSSDHIKCSLLNRNGIIVQLFLVFMVFVILICKRHTEHPRRKWKIWFLDILQQGISSTVCHLLNIQLAVVFSQTNKSDACNWYFITFALDCTIGVYLCYLLMKGLENAFDNKYRVGAYIEIENPEYEIDIENRHLLKPKIIISYKRWLGQLFIWNLVVVISKMILFGVQVVFEQFLSTAASNIFVALDPYPEGKLVLIMVILPAIMNALAFWAIDNILKQDISNFDDDKDPFNKILAKYIYEDYDIFIRKQTQKKIDAQKIQMIKTSNNQYEVKNDQSDIKLRKYKINEHDEI